MGGIYNSSPVLLYIFCTFVNRTQLFIVEKLLLEPFFISSITVASAEMLSMVCHRCHSLQCS